MRLGTPCIKAHQVEHFGAMTLFTKAFSIGTLLNMTFLIMTFLIMTFSTLTFLIMTFCLIILYAYFNMQHSAKQY
jgi:hypothetical protein